MIAIVKLSAYYITFDMHGNRMHGFEKLFKDWSYIIIPGFWIIYFGVDCRHRKALDHRKTLGLIFKTYADMRISFQLVCNFGNGQLSPRHGT